MDRKKCIVIGCKKNNRMKGNFTHTYVCMYILNVYTHMYVYVFMYIHVCVYVYVCIQELYIVLGCKNKAIGVSNKHFALCNALFPSTADLSHKFGSNEPIVGILKALFKARIRK